MIITSDAVPKNACGWGTRNNYITSCGLIIQACTYDIQSVSKSNSWWTGDELYNNNIIIMQKDNRLKFVFRQFVSLVLSLKYPAGM